MKSNKRTVAVIGVGHVGAHCAYAMAIQGVADEIILLDKNEQKAKSECQDLMDTSVYYPHRVKFRVGDFSDLKDAAVIVNSVGDINILRGSTERCKEMEFTTRAVNSYMDKVRESGFDGVIINITNPCDVITWRIAQLAGLPKGRVFGTGAALDTARLRSVLAQKTGYDPHSVTGYMLGEHGGSQMVAWSTVAFGGKRLSECDASDPRFSFDREQVRQETVGAGWETFKGKFCTEYGIASTMARLVRAVLDDEKCVMPVSGPLDGEYGETGMFTGVPAVVGANGVEEVVEVELTDEEKAAFAETCRVVRGNMETSKQYW